MMGSGMPGYQGNGSMMGGMGGMAHPSMMGQQGMHPSMMGQGSNMGGGMNGQPGMMGGQGMGGMGSQMGGMPQGGMGSQMGGMPQGGMGSGMGSGQMPPNGASGSMQNGSGGQYSPHM